MPKMRFKELLATVADDEKILKRLFKLYPDQKKSKEGYRRVLTDLRKRKPKETDLPLDLVHVEDEDEKWVSIGAIEDGESVSLMVASWGTWLGLEVTEETREQFGDLDIICYCLWEMTFVGFSEREVQATLREMNKSYKGVMEMSEEELEKLPKLD